MPLTGRRDLSLHHRQKITCTIITAATSPVGGAKAQADLKKVLSSTLSLIYPSVEYLLPSANEKFDSAGKLIDETAHRRLIRYIHGFVERAIREINESNKM